MNGFRSPLVTSSDLDHLTQSGKRCESGPKEYLALRRKLALAALQAGTYPPKGSNLGYPRLHTFCCNFIFLKYFPRILK